ncbi:MAG: hypothetical protein AAGJ70_10905 [Pseudomonadota bacterium]
MGCLDMAAQRAAWAELQSAMTIHTDNRSAGETRRLYAQYHLRDRSDRRRPRHPFIPRNRLTQFAPSANAERKSPVKSVPLPARSTGFFMLFEQAGMHATRPVEKRKNDARLERVLQIFRGRFVDELLHHLQRLHISAFKGLSVDREKVL